MEDLEDVDEVLEGVSDCGLIVGVFAFSCLLLIAAAVAVVGLLLVPVGGGGGVGVGHVRRKGSATRERTGTMYLADSNV